MALKPKGSEGDAAGASKVRVHADTKVGWPHMITTDHLPITAFGLPISTQAIQAFGSTVVPMSGALGTGGVLLSGAWAPMSPAQQQLEETIAKLRQQVAEQSQEAVEAKKAKGKAQKELASLSKTVDELQSKERLSFVLNRIHPEARTLLLESTEFQDSFLKKPACDAYVMSVDIRRSTELMLKARSPELYAQFITALCAQLRDLILSHHGVFDKFTGDGILAFFPTFYAGADAGYRALAAADACHKLFHSQYAASRKCFVSVLKDVGLGIGIDYGATHLVQVGDGLTVVGTPVVYACRMASGAAGHTLLNQPAYEQVFDRYSAFGTFAEAELDVKHEGAHVAYPVVLNGKAFEPAAPGWHAFRPRDDQAA